jgi:hypothetical protein
MRTKLRSKILLLFMTFGLMLAIPVVALADNVVDDVTDDVTTGGRTITAGDSGTTVNYRIVANNGDGQTGCNASEGSPATVNIKVGSINGSDPSKVTADPASLNFNYCGTPNKPVTYTATQAGDYAITVTVADTGAGTYNTQPAAFTLKVNAPAAADDTTPPDIGYVLNPASPNGDNGWYTSDVSLTWTVVENESPGSLVTTGCDDQNITSDQQETTYSCSATSDGGSAGPVDVPIKRDATPPDNIKFIGGGLSDGARYDFGDVPLGPTDCSADDATSGVASCSVDGYSDEVGNQKVMATATDNAGNSAKNTLSYEVVGWTLKGFYPPVDMGIHNTMKGGQTVALKFEVFETLSGTELTDTSAIKTFTQKVNCTTSGGVDPIEEFATGSTTLRYDTTSGQFIFNWKSPKSPGTCYRVTMTAQDGSSISADFTLK